MGASVEYLYRHPKTGRLSYRRAFPPHLRPHVPGQLRTLKHSLGTKSISAPEAMDRFREAEREYERLLQLAVKASANTYDHLDTTRIGLLADAYAARILAEDEEKRLRGEAVPEWNEAAEDGFGELFASGNAERPAERHYASSATCMGT